MSPVKRMGGVLRLTAVCLPLLCGVAAASTPVPPVGFSVTNPNTGGKLKLSWIANTEPDMSSYGVDRGTVPNFETNAPPPVSVGFIAHPGTTITDTGLTDGVTYYYHVHAFTSAYFNNASGPSAERSGVSTTPPPPAPPGAPQGLGASNPGGPGGRLNLSWLANTEAGVTMYELYRSTYSTLVPNTFVAFILAPGTTHQNTGLATNQTYFYRLRAISAGPVSSALSNEASATPANLPPNAPQFAVQDFDPATGTSLRIFWAPSAIDTDIKDYLIYRSTLTSGPLSLLIVPPSTILAPGTTHQDSGLTSGKPYRYIVTARDTGLNESAFGSVALSVPGFPAAPTGLGVVDAGTSGRLNLSWTANSDLDLSQYRVWRALTSGPLSQKAVVTVVLAPGTTFQDRDLANGVVQFYQVTARDSSLNESAAAAEVSGTPSFAGAGETKLSVSFDLPGIGKTQIDVPTNDVRVVTETRPDVPLGMVSSEANQKIVAAVANTESGEFTFRVFTQAGELVNEIIETRPPLTSFSFIPQDLGSGIYIIEVEGPGMKKVSKKVAIGR